MGHKSSTKPPLNDKSQWTPAVYSREGKQITKEALESYEEFRKMGLEIMRSVKIDYDGMRQQNSEVAMDPSLKLGQKIWASAQTVRHGIDILDIIAAYAKGGFYTPIDPYLNDTTNEFAKQFRELSLLQAQEIPEIEGIIEEK